MIFPVKTNWKLSTDFNEMRPLSKPKAERDHPHAAWDIVVPEGTKIYAPESGKVYYHLIHVCSDHPGGLNVYWPDGTWYAFSNYSYSIWGGLIILHADSGYTYVFAHVNRDSIVEELNKRTILVPPLPDTAFGLLNLTHGKIVREGEVIGKSGNAGYSKGPHIHMELHWKKFWIPHNNRVDPARLYVSEYREHKKDLKEYSV